MVHISEFTADLIKNGKLNLDNSRNSHVIPSFHDSCNPARAMGLLEEPRVVLDAVVDKWYEMPENTIREKTYCCGSGTALNTDENMELRMRSGFPRAMPCNMSIKTWRQYARLCVRDRPGYPHTLMNYWVPEVQVCGLSEACRQRFGDRG
jgi:hypothetical protein